MVNATAPQLAALGLLKGLSGVCRPSPTPGLGSAGMKVRLNKRTLDEAVYDPIIETGLELEAAHLEI